MSLQVKSQFPIFEVHPELVYLDSASTCQRLDLAVATEQEYYFEMNANVHRGLYAMAEEASERYEAVREIVKRFIHAPSEKNIIFTHGATESLNTVVQAWGRVHLKKGDEVVLTVMEHHANLVPWQNLAQKIGFVLKFCPLTPDGNLDYDALETLVGEKTRIVSLTGLSNVLGTLTDLKRVKDLARKVGALISVDGAQLLAHSPVDVQALDLDFLSFSSHKLYGPMGTGVLYAKSEHMDAMEPWIFGGDMIRSVQLDSSTWNDAPWKFEAGTPNVSGVLGMGASLEWMMDLGWEAIESHEKKLMKKLWNGLAAFQSIQIYGPQKWPEHRGSVSFHFKGIHPHDVAAILAQDHICVRAGHHCTMPLHQALNIPATVRVSLGLYNTESDIDALLDGLKKVEKTFA